MLPQRIDKPGSDAQRFERAAASFVRACASQLAHESVYQGWLTAFAAAEFGWGRVLREVHVQAPDLLSHVPGWELAQRTFAWREKQAKGSLNLDVSISECVGLDCRKSQTRDAAISGSRIVQRLSVVSELKVAGAVANPAAQRESVWRDLLKLGLYTAAALDGTAAHRPFDAYMLVLDNFRRRDGQAVPCFDRGACELGLAELRARWAAGVPAPTLVVARCEDKAVALNFYRDFGFAPEASRSL